MKAVMLSLRPQWCEKIFNGSKSIEVRKSRPSIDTPFTVYVYETKAQFVKSVRGACTTYGYGRGKVIGSFVCDRIREIIPLGLRGFKLGAECLKEMCLSKEQLDEYGGLKTLCGWHITEPTLFEKPRGLGEFKHKIKVPWAWQENGKTIGYFYKWQPITRAPQSWVYCETIDER